MAKSAKKAKPKPKSKSTTKTKITTKTNTMNPPVLTANSLVAEEADHSRPAIINFTFTGGIGQATASLFRKGVLINMQSISSSGNIKFSDVQTGDVIPVNGICTGQAVVAIDTDTMPETPETFPAGLIIAAYLIR
jgi:hypothetical protein